MTDNDKDDGWEYWRSVPENVAVSWLKFALSLALIAALAWWGAA